MESNKSLLARLFNLLPEGSLRNKLSCFYYNHFKRNNFKMHYEKDFFAVVFDDFTLKFCDDPYPDILIVLKGYLKEYALKKGDIVVDAGAYTGAFSLIASKLVGKKGKVIAFEPDTINHQKLLDNIKLNKISNVIAIKKGLWGENTTLQFNGSGSPDSSFIFDKAKSNNISCLPAVSLDNELKKFVSKVDFIKMDAEGAELEAIKGCKNTLLNNDVRLAIASYHLVNGQKTYPELEKLLAKFGYQTETSFLEHLTTYARKSRSRG